MTGRGRGAVLSRGWCRVREGSCGLMRGLIFCLGLSVWVLCHLERPGLPCRFFHNPV